MNMKYAAGIAAITVAIVGAILVLLQFPANRISVKEPVAKIQKAVHYHAAFRIYVDGTLQNFSDIQYMSVAPCTDTPDEHEEAEKETVHLHDLVGDVIHVHSDGQRWRDVFTYVKLPVPATITAYNGKTPVASPLQSPIKAYQSMTFFVGSEPPEAEKQAIFASAPDKEYIVKAEQKSENCGTP